VEFGSATTGCAIWGHPRNHKRVHRVYCRMKLNLPRRTKRWPPTRERQPLLVVSEMNVVWALDFMRDTLYSGRVFRTLNVIDEANSGGLGIEIAVSIPAVCPYGAHLRHCCFSEL
jgi:putative transposase